VEQLSFVYTVRGHEGDDRVYVVKRGVVRAELPKPRSSWQREKLKRLARDIFGTAPEKPALAVPTHEIDELLLLSSWFRKFPAEMNRTKQIC
jgi:excinuclease ABC subunit C